MSEKAASPPGLPAESTGYRQGANDPYPVTVPFALASVPTPPPRKGLVEQIKDLAPVVGVLVVLATVIGSWRDTKTDVAQLKAYADEQKKKDAQRDADAKAAKESAAAAFSAVAAQAKLTELHTDQLKELNRVLRRLNITQHRTAAPSGQ